MPAETGKTNIVARVRKLLARTVERGATEAEMQASVTLAARLMDKYCISRAEVDARESGHGRLPIWSGSAMPPERDFLAVILKEYFHVRLVIGQAPMGVTIYAYGAPAHRQVGDHVFNMLLRTYRTLYGRYRAATPRLRRREGRMRSYYLGLTGGLFKRLRDQRGAAERAIVQTDVARDAAFDRDMGDLSEANEQKFPHVPAAIMAGRTDAEKVRIRPVISAAKEQHHG